MLRIFAIVSLLFASTAFAGSVGVTFEAVENAAGYRVYWQTDTDFGHVTLEGTTEIHWADLAPGNYEFWATAYTADGQESYPSNKVQYSVPLRPLDTSTPDKNPPTLSGPSGLTVVEQ